LIYCYFLFHLVSNDFREYSSSLLTGCLPFKPLVEANARMTAPRLSCENELPVKLTPSFVATAKAKAGAERTIYWDPTLAGFGLVVMASGARSFVVQYRAGRRSRRMAIKNVLTLDKARKQAKKLLGDVARGGDPLAERRKIEASAENTLKSIADEYFKREGARLRTVDERRRTFEKLIYPKFGSRQIASIARSEIVRLLDKIEDENGPVMADHALAYLRRLFTWHAGRSDDFRSPIVRGMARTKPGQRRRQRTLSDDELRAVWRTAEASNSAFGYFVQFLLLTAVRRTEAAHMNRGELDGDVWTIPQARYKTGLELVIPLSPAAASVLSKVPKIGKSKLVFTTDGRRPLGGFSKFKRDFDKACGVTGWTLHDLRRTARSLMSRASIPSDHAERALGHVIGGVRATYDKHQYHDEKQRAFEALAAQIERIINPQDNVVSLRGAS
jgi:integrase